MSLPPHMLLIADVKYTRLGVRRSEIRPMEESEAKRPRVVNNSVHSQLSDNVDISQNEVEEKCPTEEIISQQDISPCAELPSTSSASSSSSSSFSEVVDHIPSTPTQIQDSLEMSLIGSCLSSEPLALCTAPGKKTAPQSTRCLPSAVYFDPSTEQTRSAPNLISNHHLVDPLPSVNSASSLSNPSQLPFPLPPSLPYSLPSHLTPELYLPESLQILQSPTEFVNPDLKSVAQPASHAAVNGVTSPENSDSPALHAHPRPLQQPVCPTTSKVISSPLQTSVPCSISSEISQQKDCSLPQTSEVSKEFKTTDNLRAHLVVHNTQSFPKSPPNNNSRCTSASIEVDPLNSPA
eukprot:825638_1